MKKQLIRLNNSPKIIDKVTFNSHITMLQTHSNTFNNSPHVKDNKN